MPDRTEHRGSINVSPAVEFLNRAAPDIAWAALRHGQIPWDAPVRMEAGAAFMRRVDADGPEGVLDEMCAALSEVVGSADHVVTNTDSSLVARLDGSTERALALLQISGGSVCQLHLPGARRGPTSGCESENPLTPTVVLGGQWVMVPPGWGVELAGWEWPGVRAVVAVSADRPGWSE